MIISLHPTTKFHFYYSNVDSKKEKFGFATAAVNKYIQLQKMWKINQIYENNEIGHLSKSLPSVMLSHTFPFKGKATIQTQVVAFWPLFTPQYTYS